MNDIDIQINDDLILNTIKNELSKENNSAHRYNPFILLKETPFLDEVIQADKQKQSSERF